MLRIVSLFRRQAISSGDASGLGDTPRLLLPLFRGIRFSDRKRWLKSINRSESNRTIVFMTTFNCSHARIKDAINRMLPCLKCTLCYKSDRIALANLCKLTYFQRVTDLVCGSPDKIGHAYVVA